MKTDLCNAQMPNCWRLVKIMAMPYIINLSYTIFWLISWSFIRNDDINQNNF